MLRVNWYCNVIIIPFVLRIRNLQDYASLVGKTKTQALKDINAFIGQGILRKYGTGRSVVYIKAE